MTAARLSGRARRDLLAAATWIARENPNAAQALRDSVLVAAQRIGSHPQLGISRSKIAKEPYRFLVLAGFPYIVVYNAMATPPIVLRILHGARDLPELLKDL